MAVSLSIEDLLHVLTARMKHPEATRWGAEAQALAEKLLEAVAAPLQGHVMVEPPSYDPEEGWICATLRPRRQGSRVPEVLKGLDLDSWESWAKFAPDDEMTPVFNDELKARDPLAYALIAERDAANEALDAAMGLIGEGPGGVVDVKVVDLCNSAANRLAAAEGALAALNRGDRVFAERVHAGDPEASVIARAEMVTLWQERNAQNERARRGDQRLH